jgi:hypothetical protein
MKKEYFFYVLLFLILFFSYGVSYSAEESLANPVYINRLLRLPVPEQIIFCNEQLPLDFEDVKERLDYEIVNIMGSPVTTTMWFKRANKYFGEIDNYLTSFNLPADFKYVALIESNLRCDAKSSAGAGGPWQFMEATGKSYGLCKNPYVDERLHWDESTKAAIRHLSDLKNDFGSCFLALAAYNAGSGRVRNAMREQQENTFFALRLPRETERYVLRAVAAKLIMENPQKYGIFPENASLYSPEKFEEITMVLTDKFTSVLSLAKNMGVSYRYFFELNPHVTSDKLPAGKYTFKLPYKKSKINNYLQDNTSDSTNIR